MDINTVLTQLKDVYLLRDGLQSHNFPLPEELEDQIDDLEQSVITSWVIPELEQKAQSLLADLRCNIYLSVTKNSEGVVTVSDEYRDIPRQEGPGQQQDAETDSDCLEEPNSFEEHPDPDDLSSIVYPTREGFEAYLDQLKYPDGSPCPKVLILNYKRAIDNPLVLKILQSRFKMRELFQMIDKRQVQKLKSAVAFDESCAKMYQNHPSEMLKHYMGYLSTLDADNQPNVEDEGVTNPSVTQDANLAVGRTSLNAVSGEIKTDKVKRPYNPEAELVVEFPDGTIYDDKKAIWTFVRAIEKIGFEKVAKVGIEIQGYNLVDKRQRTDNGRTWQKHIGSCYVYSHLSNDAKKRFLDRISNYYNLNLKIVAQ